jgi:16S rRNA (guanine527-N7)-methyltransferase
MSELSNSVFDPKSKLAALAKRAKVHDFDMLIEKCTTLYQILTIANEQVNLTRIDSEEGFWIKHVADSLMLGVAFPDLTQQHLRVGDIGCGAGFPSLVLAMAYPGWKISAIDSVGKKTAFVESAAVGLELKNLEVINGRTREMGHRPLYQKKFDLLTARAVGVIPTIYADARRLIADRGRWIFYKTPEQAAQELETLQKTPPPGARLKWQATKVEELPDGAGSRLFVHARS